MKKLLFGLALLLSLSAIADSIDHGDYDGSIGDELYTIAEISDVSDVRVEINHGTAISIYEGETLLYKFNKPGWDAWRPSFIKRGKAYFERDILVAQKKCERGSVALQGKIINRRDSSKRYIYPTTENGYTFFTCICSETGEDIRITP